MNITIKNDKKCIFKEYQKGPSSPAVLDFNINDQPLQLHLELASKASWTGIMWYLAPSTILQLFCTSCSFQMIFEGNTLYPDEVTKA